MAEYMNKEVFLSSMGLIGDETKYGNRDAEHQHRSFSTYMSYEIMDSVEDSIVEEELAPVRHGRWEDKPNPQWKAYDIRYCTACGWSIHKSKLRKADLNWAYCPNCGAKMDGTERS